MASAAVRGVQIGVFDYVKRSNQPAPIGVYVDLISAPEDDGFVLMTCDQTKGHKGQQG